jgi:hypothetical protein
LTRKVINCILQGLFSARYKLFAGARTLGLHVVNMNPNMLSAIYLLQQSPVQFP